MVRAPIRVPRWPAAAAEGPDFAAIRAEFDVPEEFSADVLAEAERRAAEPPWPELDATDVPLVTLDPVGSRDLDQAVHLARRGDGYRVSYAIADVGAFVALGSRLDAEARRRGQTLYSPDRRTPLHPPVLSEGAASLLADQLRPAVLWTIDVDADGARGLREAQVAAVQHGLLVALAERPQSVDLAHQSRSHLREHEVGVDPRSVLEADRLDATSARERRDRGLELELDSLIAMQVRDSLADLGPERGHRLRCYVDQRHLLDAARAHGRGDLAAAWIHGLARSANQGPFGQAHFADGGTFDQIYKPGGK